MSDILLVDDDAGSRRMLAISLEKEGHSVRVASTVDTAWAEMGRKAPDLAVVEVRLAGMSGFDLCRRMKAEEALKAVPVVFLTAQGEESKRVAGLELGADDYVVKPFSLPELLARLRMVLRRAKGLGVDAEVLSAGPVTVNTGEKLATVEGKTVPLTPKELDLLCLFLRRKRRALGRTVISEEVWGREFTATSRTIDTHISGLRRKLGAWGRCIQTVENTGYRWMDPEDE